MIRTSAWMLVLAMCSIGCEREPAIMVRFDAADLASRGDFSVVAKDAASAPAQGSTVDAGGTATVEKTKRTQCKSDADCVLVPVECCSCANGGRLRAIAKHDEDAARAAQTKKCADVMCTMMVSTDPSCGQRPSCVANQCTLRAARADEIRKLPAKATDVQ